MERHSRRQATVVVEAGYLEQGAGGLRPCEFSNKSMSIVNEIIADYNKKTADAVTTRRFKHAYIYIMNHAAFPKPVIMMKVSSGMSVLDGSHRMAAFCMLQMTPDATFKKLNKRKASPTQDAWVGTHSAGEVPLT